jgi:hypothetical protein
MTPFDGFRTKTDGVCRFFVDFWNFEEIVFRLMCDRLEVSTAKIDANGSQGSDEHIIRRKFSRNDICQVIIKFYRFPEEFSCGILTFGFFSSRGKFGETHFWGICRG